MNNQPEIVKRFAKQANGVPIAWNVTEDKVVIVFEDGRKLFFEVKPGKTDPGPKPAPVKTAGAVQEPPIEPVATKANKK
jgi:hypothetical protein